MRWHESKNGPGWTEILGYMTALDDLHRSTTWLDLSPAGSQYGTAWRASVVTVLPALSGPARAVRVVSACTWPNVDSADLASAIFKLIIDHDYKISREAYVQERLPGA